MKLKVRISSRIFINISFFYTLFVSAICYTIISPILIEIAKHININVGRIGLIFSFYFGGFIIGCLLSSWIINYFERKKLLSIFYFSLFGAIFSMAFAFNFIYIAVIYFILGISGGFIESQISSLLIDINKKSEGLFVNLSQTFFGIGAFIGPLITVAAEKIDLEWNYAYMIAGILCFVNFIFFLFIDISTHENKKKAGLINTLNMGGIKNKSIFMLLILAIFFYVCTEVGLAGWIPTFLRLNKSFNSIVAGQVLSFFWIAIMAGRIFVGFLTKKIKILKILIFMSCLSVAAIVAGIYSENNSIIIISFILAGLFLAGIWPLIITEGGLIYPQNRNFVVSMLVLFGGVGGLFTPIFLNIIYNRLDLFIAMNTNYIFLILLLVPIIVLFIISRKTKA